MQYNDFNEETKLFLNKAMDIYATIKDNKIKQTIPKIIGTIDHEFTKYDKKMLSLFIAGFLVNSTLKKILSNYDDIKLDDLLDFIEIKEEFIKPLEDGNYEKFFNENLKLDLITILKYGNSNTKINFISPELIVSSLQFVYLNGSEILDYYWQKKYNNSLFSIHPLFDALENYILTDGSVSKKVSPVPIIDDPLMPITQPQDEPKSKKKDNIEDSVWHLLD